MSQRYQQVIIILLMFSLLVTGVLAVDGPVITPIPANDTLDIGESTAVAVVMDVAPTGLSGFNVTVSLTEPSVGDIINVTYPDWAILPLNSSLPADYVSVQAVELMSLVGPGAANINLCTLTVRGDTAGETNLTFTLMKIEDDVGGRYAPETTDANMIVEDPNVPAANFTANVTSGTVPLEVQFTDMSIGNPISWSWLFGDGTTSPDQYPVHTYNLPGNYTVTLTINDGAGIYTRPKYIKVTPIRFGDANGDDMINQADTLRVMKEVVGLEKKPERGEDLFRKTDIHHNDVIDVGDAMFIAQYNVGLRDVWFEKI